MFKINQIGIKVFICISALLLISGCVKYSPYEIRLDESEKNLTNKNLEKLCQIPEKDTFIFVFAGDAQRYYDEAFPLVESINKDKNIDFVIFAGDLTDFGLAQEFEDMNNIISELNVPYLCVIGNHDLIYNGGEVYKQMFGSYDFTFDFHDFRFVFLNTNSREFGFSGDVPSIPYLNQNLTDTANYYGAIVVVHVPPGNNDFDNTLEEEFANALSYSEKTIMELNGHNHNHGTNFPYYKDIEYITSYSLKKKKYLKFKIWKDNEVNQGYSFDVIRF